MRLDYQKIYKAPFLPLNAERAINIFGGLGLPMAVGEYRAGVLTQETPTDLIAEVYDNDVKFRLSPKIVRKFRNAPNPRGLITHFSRQSRRRLQFTVRNTADMWQTFLTLTYPAEWPTSGPETKKHLNAFCAFLRRKKIAYLWILEFQKRGAPHYHFILSGYVDKAEVADRWYRIVKSGDPKHLEAGTRIEGIKNPDQVGKYLSAYMSKLEQKRAPKQFRNVGRFWGSSRLLKKTLYRQSGLYQDAARTLRTYRKWFSSHTKNDFGFKWKWKGFGFVLIDGAPLFRSLVRQTLMADQGKNVWREWDGSPDIKAQFLTLEDRMRNEGQRTLNGGVEWAHEELHRNDSRVCWAKNRGGAICEKPACAAYRLNGTVKEITVCYGHIRDVERDGKFTLIEEWSPIREPNGNERQQDAFADVVLCGNCSRKKSLGKPCPHCGNAAAMN